MQCTRVSICGEHKEGVHSYFTIPITDCFQLNINEFINTASPDIDTLFNFLQKPFGTVLV